VPSSPRARCCGGLFPGSPPSAPPMATSTPLGARARGPGGGNLRWYRRRVASIHGQEQARSPGSSVVANGRFYLRDQNYLFCYEVRARNAKQ